MNFNYLSLLMIVSSIISLFLSLYAWRKRRDNLAVLSLSLLLAAATIWSFGYGLEVASTNLAQMKIAAVFAYIGIATIPVFFLIFAARYSGNDAWLTPFIIKLLFIIPTFSVMMVATNDLHKLFYSTVELGLSGGYFFQKTQAGPFWWIHVTYSYLALLLGLVFFIRMFFKVLKENRLYIGFFIAGSLLPCAVNFAYVAGLKPYGFLDLTPIAFICTGGILSLGIFTIKLFNIIPLALDMLFNNIPDAIIVLDTNRRVINANPTGQALLESGFFQKTVNGLSVTDPFTTGDFFSTQPDEREFKIGEKVYVNTNTAIISPGRKRLGTLMVIRDISEHKRNEEIQQALYNISKTANSAISLSQLYQKIHQQLGTLIDTTNFYIALADKEKNKVSFPYNKDEFHRIHHPRTLRHHSLVARVIRTGKPIFVNQKIMKEKSFCEEDKKWFGSKRKAWLGVPFKIQEETIGAMVVQSYTDPDRYSEKDIQLLEFISSQISIAIKRKEDEEALSKSQQEFVSLFQSNPEATVYTDGNGNVLNINARFTELFGYTLDEIKGKSIDIGLIQPPDKIKESKELTEKGLNEDYISFETVRKKKDGTIFPVYISGSPMYIDGKSQGIIRVYQDITERKKMEEQLEKLARLDPLTGCYNRRYGLELLDRQVKLSRRNQFPLLMAFLDIDNFKVINDTFGHKEGDQVLKEVVGLFNSTLREVDIICRMGGDEFLLAFPDNLLEEAALIKNRLEEKLSQLNSKRKKGYQIKFSMGFSEYLPNEPKSLDELVSIADQRMYGEKRKNKEI